MSRPNHLTPFFKHNPLPFQLLPTSFVTPSFGTCRQSGVALRLPPKSKGESDWWHLYYKKIFSNYFTVARSKWLRCCLGNRPRNSKAVEALRSPSLSSPRYFNRDDDFIHLANICSTRTAMKQGTREWRGSRRHGGGGTGRIHPLGVALRARNFKQRRSSEFFKFCMSQLSFVCVILHCRGY